MLKRMSALFAIFLIFAFSGAHASAKTVPSFASCVNPTGNISATYNSGDHGIAGSTNTYTGSDTVYQLTDGNAMQCFCGNGQGIQTNWLKASGFSEDEIKVLKSQGWITIPDGSAWGLEQGAYLAQNSDFSCQGGSANGNSGSSNGSSNSSSASSDPARSVLAATADAVALANTGNMRVVMGVFFLGIGTLIAAISLKRFSK